MSLMKKIKQLYLKLKHYLMYVRINHEIRQLQDNIENQSPPEHLPRVCSSQLSKAIEKKKRRYVLRLPKDTE